MRYTYSLIWSIFLSSPLMAADCTHLTNYNSNGGIHDCDNLTISAPLFHPLPTGPLILKVKGTVDITDLTVGGQDGVAFETAVNDIAVRNDGFGGPGAGHGGWLSKDEFDVHSPLPGSDGPPSAGSIGSCSLGFGGGSGGGYASSGSNGLCPDINDPPSLGGGISAASFTAALRGGFGGGSGDGSSFIATGGGGGGAIRIIAQGDVIIRGNLSANGGAGASSSDAGGGGGSGGIIWIQSKGNIEVAGSLTARGGEGGNQGVSGEGGNGGDGYIRLEDQDGTITGGGSISPTPEILTFVAAKPMLKSGITCGSIDDKQNQTFQLIMGFLLAFLLANLSNKFKKKHRPLA